MENKIKELDFNYYIDENKKYVFYFLGYNGDINIIKDYGFDVDPLITIKTLVVEGLRYNPYLKYNR